MTWETSIGFRICGGSSADTFDTCVICIALQRWASLRATWSNVSLKFTLLHSRGWVLKGFIRFLMVSYNVYYAFFGLIRFIILHFQSSESELYSSSYPRFWSATCWISQVRNLSLATPQGHLHPLGCWPLMAGRLRAWTSHLPSACGTSSAGAEASGWWLLRVRAEPLEWSFLLWNAGVPCCTYVLVNMSVIYAYVCRDRIHRIVCFSA